MESELDLKPLIEWILSQIVFAGDDGISVSKLIALIDVFYNVVDKNDVPQAGAMEVSSKSSDGVSSQDEGGQGNPKSKVDNGFRIRVWDHLRMLPDVLVGEDREGNSLGLQQLLNLQPMSSISNDKSGQHQESSFNLSDQSLENFGQTVHPETESSTAAFQPKDGHHQLRIYVSEDRLWQTIAGHGVDYQKLPQAEWILLCEIAAAGERGITLPNARQRTGQQKQTTPGLTEALQHKGYIVKRRIKVPKISDTTLLILKKYANRRTAATLSIDVITRDMEPLPGNEDWTGKFIDTETFARCIMAVIKAWETISYHNLRKKMGIHPHSWHDQKLLEAVQELKNLGVFRTTQPNDSHEKPAADEDSFLFLRDLAEDELSKFRRQPINTGKRLSKFKRKPKPVPRKSTGITNQSVEDDEDINFVGDSNERTGGDMNEANAMALLEKDQLEFRELQNTAPQDLNADNSDSDTIHVVSRTQTEEPGQGSTPQPVAPKKRRGRPRKSLVESGPDTRKNDTKGLYTERDLQTDARADQNSPRALSRASSTQENNDIGNLQTESDVRTDVQVAPNPVKRRGRPPGVKNRPKSSSLLVEQRAISPSFGPRSSRSARARKPTQDEIYGSTSPSSLGRPLSRRLGRSPSPSLRGKPRAPHTSTFTSYDDYMREDGVPGVYFNASNITKPLKVKGRKQMIAIFKSQRLRSVPWMHINDDRSQHKAVDQASAPTHVLETQLDTVQPTGYIIQDGADTSHFSASNERGDPFGTPKASLSDFVRNSGANFSGSYISPYQSLSSTAYVSPYQSKPDTQTPANKRLLYDSLTTASIQNSYKSPYTASTPSILASQSVSLHAPTTSFGPVARSQEEINPTPVSTLKSDLADIGRVDLIGERTAPVRSSQERLTQEQLAEETLAEEKLYDAMREAGGNLPSDASSAMACVKDGVIGALCLTKDKSTLEFLPVDVSVESSYVAIPVSEIKSPPSASDPSSKLMELRVSVGEDDSSDETVYRFRFLEEASRAANMLRAKIVTAMTVLQFGNGGILPGASSEPAGPEKPFKCETCGRTWKNKLGQVYHQTKSQTSCNPDWIPPLERTPKRVRKAKVVKKRSEVTQVEEEEDLYDNSSISGSFTTPESDEEQQESPMLATSTTPKAHRTATQELNLASKSPTQRALWPKPKTVKPTFPVSLRVHHIKENTNDSRQSRKRAAAHRSYGDLQRHKDIIMSLVDANDGVFPADDSLRVALGNMWIRDFSSTTIPDQKACNYAARHLEEDGSIITLHFSFKDLIGVMVTRALLAKPGTAPFETKVMTMKENIKKNHPDPYVPPAFAPSADLRSVLEGRSSRRQPVDSLRFKTSSSGRETLSFGDDVGFLNMQLERSMSKQATNMGSNGAMDDGVEGTSQYELIDGDSDEYHESSRRPKLQRRSGSRFSDESKQKRSQLMKRHWKNVKATGSTRLLPGLELDLPQQTFGQYEAMEYGQDEAGIGSDSPESPLYRLSSVEILSTSTAYSSGAWRPLLAFYQDPKTGAWNKKQAEKKWTRLAVKSKWPEPTTYLQSSNGAWNTRPFGHGVRPIYSRPSKRKDGWFASDSNYLKRLHTGFRPVVMPTKGMLLGPTLPATNLKLSPKPQEGRKKRKYTRSKKTKDTEFGAETVDASPDVAALSSSSKLLAMQQSIENGYPEVTFLAPNTHLFDGMEVEHTFLNFEENSTWSRGTAHSSVASPIVFQFQPLKILECDNGKWPDLSEWYFVEGSYSVQGWFPSAKYILRQHLPNQIESIRGDCETPKIQPSGLLTSQYDFFSSFVDKVAEWEQDTGKDVLKIGTLAPDFVFYNHTISSLQRTDEAPKAENQWLDSFSFTIQTLPYDELENDPDAIAKSLPRFLKKRQSRPMLPTSGSQSRYDESQEQDYSDEVGHLRTQAVLNRAKRYPRRRQKTVRYTAPPEYFLDQVPENLNSVDEESREYREEDEPFEGEESEHQNEEYDYRESRRQLVQFQDPGGYPDGARKELSKSRRQTALQADLSGLLGVVSKSTDVAVEIDYTNTSEAGHGLFIAGTTEKRTSPETDNRIMVTVTVIRTLTGGLDKTIDWVLVSRLFPEHSMTSVQSRWVSLSKQHRGMLEQFTSEFQEIFLEAYESNEVPAIDYDHLLGYDWNGLINWVMERMESMDIFVQLLTRLPASRNKLNMRYDVREETGSSKPHAWQDDWFSYQRSIHERMEAATSFQYTTNFSSKSTLPKALDDITIAKSWARASILTPIETYNARIANQKMSMLDADVLNSAVTDLVKSKVIAAKYKGRVGPDRGYDVTEVFNSSLRKTIKESQFKQAAAFKSHLDSKFRANETVKVEWTADDGSLLAITNLQAHGRINLAGHGIPADKFGMQDPGNYQSKQIPKSRLHFEIQILPTETYIYDEDHEILKRLLLPEFCAPHGPDHTLPLWYDIAEKLLPHMWITVLAGVLGTLALRPGMPIVELTNMFAPAIEQWEMRILVEWGVKIGVLVEAIPGHEGWNVGEWWWLAVGRCVDTL